MKLNLTLLLVCLVLGCSAPPSDPIVTPESGNLKLVRTTISELMAIPEHELRNDIPLSQLATPMDDLDLVELVMELEDKTNVAIPDKLLVDAAGTDGANVLPSRLDINKLVAILDSAPASPPPGPSQSNGVKEPVVKLSSAAAAKLLTAQQQSGKPLLRIAVKSGGSTGFMYDLQFADSGDAENDIQYEHEGVSIVVDRKSAIFLEGATIDWRTAADGRSGFEFDNPNAVDDQ